MQFYAQVNFVTKTYLIYGAWNKIHEATTKCVKIGSSANTGEGKLESLDDVLDQ